MISDQFQDNPLVVIGEETLSGASLFTLQGTEGWVSPSYNQLNPCLNVLLDSKASLPIRRETAFCFDGADLAELLVEWTPHGLALPSLKRITWRSESIEITENGYGH
jgi:hypothetical protein